MYWYVIKIKLVLYWYDINSTLVLTSTLISVLRRKLLCWQLILTQYVYPVWQPVVEPRPVGVGEPRLGPRDQGGLVTPAEGLGLRPAEGLRRYQESLPFNRPIVPVDLYIHVKVQDCQRHSVHSSS